VPEEALAFFRQALACGAEQEAAWRQRLVAYQTEFPTLADEYERTLAGHLPEGWEAALPLFAPGDGPMATRKASGKVLAALAPHLWNLVGGSADLNPSTNTALAGRGDFQRPLASRPSAQMEPAPQGAAGGVWGWAGQNVHFGVREHAMRAILNGIALHGGLIAYGATFLIFSDYMRPPMRLAALMNLGI
jgi:transketolase